MTMIHDDIRQLANKILTTKPILGNETPLSVHDDQIRILGRPPPCLNRSKLTIHTASVPYEAIMEADSDPEAVA